MFANLIYTYEDFQQYGISNQQRLRLACAYYSSLEYSMSVKLLNENHLEFLSLIGGCTCSSESTLDKMPCCRKSHVAAHIIFGGTQWLGD